MNVIIGNAQQGLLSNLDIDVIKSISGVFTSKELVGMFRNFFFNKMVLDVTAIKDCGNINSYKELANGLDSDKIIYFIPENSPLCTAAFFSDLVTIGIYNFTTNVEGIKYLLRHSNTYNEVAQFQQSGRMNNINYNNYQHPQDFSNNSNVYDASNDYYNMPSYGTDNQNYNQNYNQVNNQVNVPAGFAISQSPLLSNMNNNNIPNQQQNVRKDNIQTQVVIGVKSITLSAGASTLIYMMKKELNAKIGQNVLAVEVDKRDFKLFNEKNMDSISKNELRNYIERNSDAQVIIVDLNDYIDGENLCDDVIYLLESSIIKLNRLLQMDSKVLGRLRGKRVVLNRSLLSNKDIADFEYESGLKVFYNIPPLDERKHNEVIVDFLSKLGLLNLNSRNTGRVFGLFRR